MPRGSVTLLTHPALLACCVTSTVSDAVWHAAGPRVGRSAVGAHIDRGSQAIGEIVIGSRVGDARFRGGGGVAEGTGSGLVVVALAVGDQEMSQQMGQSFAAALPDSSR